MAKTEKPNTIPIPAPSGSSMPNWTRASVKLVPYIGAALDEIIFGGLTNVRWARLERTLAELGEMMREREIPPGNVGSEDFAALLEVAGPVASLTTNEEKRCLLRDLLLNAADLPSSDPEWESARLAASLISSLEAPALAILAALAKVGARGPDTAELERTGDSGQIATHGKEERTVVLRYHWFVLEQAYRSLSANQPRLVIAGSHGRDTYEKIALTPVGDFLLKWSTAQPIGSDS